MTNTTLEKGWGKLGSFFLRGLSQSTSCSALSLAAETAVTQDAGSDARDTLTGLL